MHDPDFRDNPPMEGDAKRTRPFDFQHHYFNQSHPDIPKFLARVRSVAEAGGAAFLVAEVGGEQADREMKLYTEGADRLHSAYGFQFLYADKLTPALVRASADNWRGDGEQGWPAWAFSNHDAPRVVSRWARQCDEAAFAKQALLLLVALRGSVFLYQGEELGLPQGTVPRESLRDPEAIANWPHTLGRDGARTPMPWQCKKPNAGFSRASPWLPLDPAHRALAVDAQESDTKSTLQFARRAIALRRRLPALATGALYFLETPDPIIAFTRGGGSDAVLCAFNLGDKAIAWSLPDGWEIVEAVNASSPPSAELPSLAGIVAQRR
jgi:alpha-glucosidase